MSNREIHDWSLWSDKESSLDLFGNMVRYGVSDEKYADKTTFKAVALTDSFELTANQSMALDGGSTGDATDGANARKAFRARIIGENSPHSFLPDPCDPAYAGNLDYVYKLITMHTMFISISITKDIPVTRGDIVLVRLKRSNQAYNLEYGAFEELLAIEDPSGKAGEQCSSLIDLFGEIVHEAMPQPGGVVQTAAATGADGGITTAADPGNCPWSNGVSRLVMTWSSAEYPAYNGKVLKNGSLEETGMLVEDAARGAKLVPPAMADFLKLAAAYEKKFPGKVLKGSGYRSYAGQVHQRMRRNATKCGSGNKNSAGSVIGNAATPGRSNHGWGAAIDLDRKEWTKGRGNKSPEFRWINKFSKRFNFVFGVGGEHWHLDWTKFGAQTGGAIKTKQVAWTSAGQDDETITLV